MGETAGYINNKQRAQHLKNCIVITNKKNTMKNLKTLHQAEITILTQTPKGTLIIDNSDYKKFELTRKPFNITATPKRNSINEIIYEVRAAFNHSFAPSKRIYSLTSFYKILW